MAEKKKQQKGTASIAQYKSSRDIPYHKIKMTCVCGAEYEGGSTLDTIRVDICANCHPFFTGENKILDAEGRVEKFRKKYEMAAKAKKK